MDLSFFLGLAVAFGGALLLATGSELQSHAVFHGDGRWRTFLRSPRWHIGLSLLGVAVSTNFIALALTPVSAVQSMSVVALAASATFGALAGRVVMTRAGLGSVALCMVGILGFIALLATHPATGTPTLDDRTQLAVVTGILLSLVLLGGGAAVLSRRVSTPGTRLFALIIGAMVFGSITTVFKVLVTLVLDDGLIPTITSPLALAGLSVVALGGFVANLLLQRSHRFFPVPVVVAALTIVDPLTAAVVGITVLGEVSLTPLSSVALVVCGGIACVGVLGISRLQRKTAPPDQAPPAANRLSHS